MTFISKKKSLVGIVTLVAFSSLLTSCASSETAASFTAETYESVLQKASSDAISRNSTDESAKGYSVSASAYFGDKVHGIILAENFNEKDILNATNQLKWRYPARTIAICANAVTSFNPNIHTKIEKEFKATCPETLEFDVAKNFVGLLTSYEYRNSETGLFAIVQDNGSDRYEAYFVNVTFKNGSLEYNLVGGAYLSEDGPGILSVEWSDGARDAARFYDDGTVAFECQNHLNEFVSRADCELSQDFDTMSTGIRLVSDATDVQWQDKDAMANDLGNILTIKLDTFSPELVDFYQFKSFSIGQSGGMFPSGSYGVRDLGFGLLQVINQSNRDTTLGFFDNDNYSYGAIISFWVGGEWIDFLFPKT